MEMIGKLVWGGCADGTIFVWNAETRAPITSIPRAHKKKINAFAELEGNIWSGSDDGFVLVWDKNYQVKTRSHQILIQNIHLLF